MNYINLIDIFMEFYFRDPLFDAEGHQWRRSALFLESLVADIQFDYEANPINKPMLEGLD